MHQCPYCHGTLNPPPRPRCPHCGRIMRVPRPPASKTTPTLEARRRLRLEAERQRKAMRADMHARLNPRKGLRTAIVLVVMFLLGLTLVTQTRIQRDTPLTGWQPEFKAEQALRVLRVGLEHFHNDTGRYPSEREGLLALIANPDLPGWNGPYVTLIRGDPWERPYEYRLEAGKPRIGSAGPDRIPGNADDLTPADWELLYAQTVRSHAQE